MKKLVAVLLLVMGCCTTAQAQTFPSRPLTLIVPFPPGGSTDAAARIFEALFDAATYMDLNRLPELFCGFPRVRGRGPTLYPVACAPQAWASGALYALLEASLGIEQDPWAREIRFRNPILPGFLDEVVLRDLACGDAAVDIAVGRHGGDKISLQVLKSRGDVEVNVHVHG